MKEILFKKGLQLIALMVLGVVALSCKSDDTDARYVLWYPDTTQITYDEDEWSYKVLTDELTGTTIIPIYMGYGALQLGVEYTSSGELNCGDWSWISSDESVAVVSSDGVVYPVGEGIATIEVAILPSEESATSCRDQIIISVDDKLTIAEEITVTSALNTVYEGGYRLQLTGAVSKTFTDPVNGTDATYNTFKWHSSNPSIADIDDHTGIVTTSWLPRDEVSVDFFATAVDGSDVVGSTTIKVINAIAPDSIVFSASTLALDGGYLPQNWGTFQIAHTLYPADATSGLVEWTSSNENVIKIHDGGYVEFVGGFADNVTITAQCYGSEQEAQVITVSVAAGYFYENFLQDPRYEYDFTIKDWVYNSDYADFYDEYNEYLFMWGMQSNGFNQSDDFAVNWFSDGYLQFSTWSSGDSERGDMMCTQTEQMGMNTAFPYFVMHLDKISGVYPNITSGQGMNFDITAYDNGNLYYPGLKYALHQLFDIDDYTQFLFMDIREIVSTVDDELVYMSDYIPSGVGEEFIPWNFNMAHTGLGDTGGDPVLYNVYAVFSLPADTNINEYIEEYKKTWVNPDPTIATKGL